MEVKCFIKNCKNKSEEKFLFHAPTNKIMLTKWQNALDTKESKFYVCDYHFKSSDLKIIVNKELKVDAVPMLFLDDDDDEIKVENDCCGVCLKTSNGYFNVTPEMKSDFKELSGYDMVRDNACYKCKTGLKMYKEFRIEIRYRHAEIRNALRNPSMRQKETSKVIPVKDLSIQMPKNTDYCCIYCPSYTTIDFEVFCGHIRDHHSFSCEKCSLTFKNGKTLLSHMDCYHRGEKRLICEFCKRDGFAHKLILDIHKQYDHSFTSFTCMDCQILFKNAVSLRVHRAIRHPLKNCKIKLNEPSTSKNQTPEQSRVEEIILRPLSTNKFRQEENNFDDVEIQQEEKEKVETVEIIEDESQNSTNESQNDEDELIEEIKSVDEKREDIHMPEEINKSLKDPQKKKKPSKFENNEDFQLEKPYSPNSYDVMCLDCNKSFSGVFKLLLHRKELHGVEVLDFELKTPPKSPSILSDLDDISKEIPIETYTSCKYCQKKIMIENMDYHLKIAHDVRESFLCHICSREFSNNRQYKNHILTHDPDYHFDCDICGFQSRSKYIIKRHIELHLNTVSYVSQCKICRIKFRMREAHLLHMKKLVNQICQFQLNTFKKYFLFFSYHKKGYDCGARVNSETNWYDCEKCGGSYSSLYHFRNHDCAKGRLQLRCPECSRPVVTEEALKKHLESNCFKLMRVSFENPLIPYAPIVKKI